MRLDEIMSKEVQTVAPELGADDAWRAMRAAHIRHLVVMVGGRVVGVVSERDLGGSRGGAVRKNRSVGELMTGNVVTAAPGTTVREAANLLRGHVIGCLPVVDGKKVVGMVTTTDLLDLLGKGASRPVPERTPWVLKARGPRRRGVLPNGTHS